MRSGSIVVALLFAAVGARAQEPPAPSAGEPQLSRTQDTRPTAQLTQEQLVHIRHIREMEQTLTTAVTTSASSLANQLQLGEPNSLFAMGNARARGFDLDDYGIIFDIDVPTLLQSVLWTGEETLKADLEGLRKQIAMTRDEDLKRILEFQAGRIERRLGLAPQSPVQTVAQAAPQGFVTATTADAAPAAPAREVPALPRDSRSPGEMYTDAIKEKLIDALLTWGPGLGIGDDQWLTLAARSTGQNVPGKLDDSTSLVIRIKGADLNAFVQRKITKEEALKRIQIKDQA